MDSVGNCRGEATHLLGGRSRLCFVPCSAVVSVCDWEAICIFGQRMSRCVVSVQSLGMGQCVGKDKVLGVLIRTVRV